MAVVNVENAMNSTYLLSQTTMRSVLGTKNLTELLSDRETISSEMQVCNYEFCVVINIHYFDRTFLIKPLTSGG